jgi:hypothetical protein
MEMIHKRCNDWKTYPTACVFSVALFAMSLLGLTVKGQALLPTPQQVEKQRGTFTPNPHRVVGMYADNDSVIAAARHLLFRGYRFAKVLDRKKAVNRV